MDMQWILLGLVGWLAGLAFLTDLVAGPAPSLARPSLLDSLFSSRHGLFFWAPVLTIAVLGLEEGCSGDPARRSGNEMLYQMPQRLPGNICILQSA